MPHHYIGADLSKDWIDIFHPKHQTHHRIANEPRAITLFLRQMEAQDILVFEATSGCDDALLSAIRAQDTAFVRTNPAHAWFFARACNLPKTDRVDARMLSAFGAARRLEPQRVNSLARDRLKALVGRRRQYKDMITQEKNRLKRTADADLKRDIQSLLTLMERRVTKLERQIADHLNGQDELSHTSRILATAPGVGPVTASVLVADMPELGLADRKQIVSLAGLAPRAYESGKYRGARRLGSGRRHVRKALYMAALSVMAQGRLFRHFVTRMRAQGKASKVIVMAVARKLLTILNTMVKRQAPFDLTKLDMPRNSQ
ncbi:MAG: IS110 family transposase [Roseibium sp.]|nr:IS110 family transposase [Roseibium sp.]